MVMVTFSKFERHKISDAEIAEYQPDTPYDVPEKFAKEMIAAGLATNLTGDEEAQEPEIVENPEAPKVLLSEVELEKLSKGDLNAYYTQLTGDLLDPAMGKNDLLKTVKEKVAEIEASQNDVGQQQYMQPGDQR